MALEIAQIPVLSDNYVYLLHDSETQGTAVVDPSVADAPMAEAERRGWRITHILNTHHHWDHTGGNEEIKQATGATIVGPEADADRIPGIDEAVKHGDTYVFGDRHRAKVFDIPGHTSGHIAFWFEGSDALLCGDTLFVLGCGRVFEGTMAQMWDSLKCLRDLPDSARVFCAHEYTEKNAAFALTVEPDNQALKDKAAQVRRLRAEGRSTVPSTLGEEKQANPFLRADVPALQAAIGMADADPVAVFAEVRRRKDAF